MRALAVTNKHTGWGVSANGGMYIDLLASGARVDAIAFSVNVGRRRGLSLYR